MTTTPKTWTVVRTWHGPVMLFPIAYPSTHPAQGLADAVAHALQQDGAALDSVTVEVIAENVGDAESTGMVNDLTADGLRYHNRGAEPPRDPANRTYVLDLTSAKTEGFKRQLTARVSEDGDVDLAH